ncbi:MAG TPA: DUF721 domain-containing protein [Candidatus Cloacimonadota bacterium]|nr:DUF721 domain-containing protein [Candidatus Cloacimonadota bacterium]
MSFTPINNLQQSVIRRIAGEQYLSFVLLYQNWNNIVGDLLAARSHPFRYQDAVLYISVQNNTWLQELFLQKKKILQQCRSIVKTEIREIIFQIRS